MNKNSTQMDTRKRKFKLQRYVDYICVHCNCTIVGKYVGLPCPVCGSMERRMETRQPFAVDNRQHGGV